MTPIELLLTAMVVVESGGDVNAVGDGGKSLGPLQIQRGYWQDAVEQLEKDGFPARGALVYERGVKNLAYCKIIVMAYWRRYRIDAYTSDPLDYETLARVHNGGGPRAKLDHPKHDEWLQATAPYWAKVKAEMERGK